MRTIKQLPLPSMTWTMVLGSLAMAILPASAQASDQNRPMAGSDAPASSVRSNSRWNAYLRIAWSPEAVFAKALWQHKAYSRKGTAIIHGAAPPVVVNPREVAATLDLLTAAIALPSPVPDVDEAAATFAQALESFAPIDRTRHEAGGNGAAEGDAAYIAALWTVVQAESAFRASVALRGEVDARLAFEASLEGTSGHYLAGLNLYRRQAVRLGKSVLSSRGSPEVTRAFGASLDRLIAMRQGWTEAVGRTAATGCRAAMAPIGDFVATGRSIVRYATRGTYRGGGKPIDAFIAPDARLFMARSEAMKKAFDRPSCQSSNGNPASQQQASQANEKVQPGLHPG